LFAPSCLNIYMVDPVPTGFKVAGASGEVGQQANGLMLSDRSAMDQFPENALAVLHLPLNFYTRQDFALKL